MSMMRYDIDHLKRDAAAADAEQAVNGYACVSKKIAEEKSHSRRQSLLLLLLFASVILFLSDNNFFIPDNNYIDSYHQAPALNDMLSGSLIEIPKTFSAVTHINHIPNDIIKFIDADISTDQKGEISNIIVIEEVGLATDDEFDVDQVLASGDRLLKRDRLMSPPGHNAYAHYIKVLSVYPGHPEALQGIRNIVDRYVYFADLVIEKNQEYKVPGLIRRAYEVGEKHMDMSVLLDKFAKYLTDESVFLDESAVDDDYLSEETVSLMDDEHYHEAVHIADSKTSAAAYQLYLDNNIASAVKVLEKFTHLSRSWGESSELLLRIYLSRGEIDKAEQLVNNSRSLNSYQLAEKAARIMMARNDNQRALNLLMAHRPKFTNNKSYYTLLAGLYHRVGNFQHSVYWYRRLLNAHHDDARLWLGLAVSLDALNKVEDALKAFDYARHYADKRSSIKHYINKRQLALTQ